MGRLLAAIALAACLHRVAGHAYLAQPKARNVLKGGDCPHCLQSGGPVLVRNRSRDHWPSREAPGSHGLCGDPVQGANVTLFRDEPFMVPSPVQEVYTAGDIVEFRIGVNTHHKGHYEFRICDRALDASVFRDAGEGQECLNQWVLERAEPAADCKPDGRADCQPKDKNNPGRWYLPPASKNTPHAGHWTVEKPATAVIAETHVMRYKIPEDLQCEHCTLQWYWATGNTCLYDGDYLAYFQHMEELGWDAKAWSPNAVTLWATPENVCCGVERDVFAEEFWNCADIQVLPGKHSTQQGSDMSPIERLTRNIFVDVAERIEKHVEEAASIGYTWHGGHEAEEKEAAGDNDTAKVEVADNDEPDHFCCMSASDPADFCSTCLPGAVPNSSTWCGISKARCEHCGSTARWCSNSTSPKRNISHRPNIVIMKNAITDSLREAAGSRSSHLQTAGLVAASALVALVAAFASLGCARRRRAAHGGSAWPRVAYEGLDKTERPGVPAATGDDMASP
mmetsp:Transcript_97957/g.277654  ORF Transcript_97957/g.277654 Transcript_97957/m.277654 type:complete len:509 (-) Transcript_97957:62-1588(-)